ncbi:ATP-binding protein [Aerosakkonema sp. BLCC-F183]|uniref:sensor histidine kinase n=1 Tax=Aerosakkonema sp. BLCC-F183 TaxID=3342834 RepID=UPI0035B6B03A
MSAIPKNIEPYETACEQCENTLALEVGQEKLCILKEELAACQAAQAKGQHYKDLFDLAPDGYLVTDSQGVIQEANRAAATLLNVSQEFLAGKPLVIFVAEQQRRLFHAKLTRRMRLSNSVQEWDVLLVPCDREPINASARVTLMRDREGKPVALGWLLRDISDRKQAELALRKRKRLIQQIANTTPNLIYIFDLKQKRNIYINRQAYPCFGYTPSQIQAMGSTFFTEIFHPDCLPKLAEIKNRFATVKDGEVLEHEFFIKNIYGEWRWFHSWDIIFTRNADGTPEQILGTAIDITDRKQAEEISLDLERDKEISQLQNRFFTMASHDFRSPLSAILASAQLLENANEELTKEKRLRNIQRIQASAKTMTQLLDDILTINRADTGKLEFDPKLIDLKNICRALVKKAEIAAASNYRINFRSEGKCKIAYMDDKLLQKILENLLANAIKYSPQGGNIDFTIVCEPAEGSVAGMATFRISDRGIGIPPKDRKYLFEAFHRGKNVGTIPGSGLGLTVVKKCLELHGGSIAVESEEGIGTTFTVTIPSSPASF